MNIRTISIAGRRIGLGEPPFLIAELSANHGGDIRRAFTLMEAAKQAGADAVKLQTYTADTITIDHDSEEFLIKGGLWGGRRLYELYQAAHTPWDWHEALFARGRELGITVFSSPFDRTAVELLENLASPAYKIASFEAVDLPLIEKAAATGKPLIISTGMANSDEIRDAVTAARRTGSGEIMLLHCVSAYPAKPKEANLMTIPDLARRFGVPVGLSDHTLGTDVAVAAVSLGASVIEKHFTLSRSEPGPDSAFSLEPEEFAALVRSSRTAWEALGCVRYGPTEDEKGSLVFRRSLYVVEDMAEGEVFTPANLRSIRPNLGLAPKELPKVLGRRASRALRRGTALKWSMVAEA